MSYDSQHVSIGLSIHFHRGDHPVTADLTEPRCLTVQTPLGSTNIFMPEDCPPNLLVAAAAALNACFVQSTKEAPLAEPQTPEENLRSMGYDEPLPGVPF